MYIVNSYIVSPAVDPDAQAFITAASITDPTQQSAVNQLVLDLKAASIWSIGNKIYPLIGGSATHHRYELKSATAAGSFSGGWTHSANGILANGSTAWLGCGVNGNFTTPDDLSVAIYVRNNTQTGYDFGCSDDGAGSVNETALISRYTNGNAYYSADQNYTLAVAQSDSRGLTLGTYNASKHRLYKNGSEIGNANLVGTGASANQIIVGALNAGGTPSFFANHEYSFVWIGGALTSTQQANLYSTVQTFQTTLSRNV